MRIANHAAAMAITPTIDETGSSLVYPDSASSTPYTGTADAGNFFETLLDIVNPLQHIPLVSNLYRDLTGDEIEPAARIVGGAVFGGPVGFASATANVLLEQVSGDDAMGHALAMFSDSDEALPLEASRQAADTGLQTAERPAPALSGEDIVWNAPRIVPSFARSEFIAENQTVKTLPASHTDATTGAEKPATTIESDAESPEPVLLAATPRETTAPAWIPDALEAAQQAETARETGNTPQPAAPQPWVAGAMLEALEKYEALSRARADDREEDVAATEQKAPDRS